MRNQSEMKNCIRDFWQGTWFESACKEIEKWPLVKREVAGIAWRRLDIDKLRKLARREAHKAIPAMAPQSQSEFVYTNPTDEP